MSSRVVIPIVIGVPESSWDIKEVERDCILSTSRTI